jgi:hypothetical protein
MAVDPVAMAVDRVAMAVEGVAGAAVVVNTEQQHCIAMCLETPDVDLRCNQDRRQSRPALQCEKVKAFF